MRTSLNEIKQIDEHILKLAAPDEALLFEARLILNPALSGKVEWQRQAHHYISRYSRKALKSEIQSVHQQLFTLPRHARFRQRIFSLFSKK
jgi:hypothetical protein